MIKGTFYNKGDNKMTTLKCGNCGTIASEHEFKNGCNWCETDKYLLDAEDHG